MAAAIISARVAVYDIKVGRVRKSEPYRAGTLTKGNQHAARVQAVERFVKGVRADGVINHRQFGAIGNLSHTADEVFFTVENRVVTTEVPH